MKYNVVKRIVQFFLALACIAGVLYASPLLAVPLTIQFGWSARSVLMLQILLAVVAGLLLADCCADFKSGDYADKVGGREITENVHTGFTEWRHWFNYRTYSSIFYWLCFVLLPIIGRICQL